MTRAFMLAAAVLAIQSPAFHSGVEVVAVDVSVTRGSAPVVGLTPSDFVVTDNGVEQRIDAVSVARVPLNVTLVLDTSTSVAGERLDALVRASELALDELRPDDDVSLVTFSSAVVRPVPSTGTFELVRSALRAINGAGRTRLRDAVFLALQAAPRDTARSLLLIFTDGIDSASWLSEAEVIESVRHASSVIHVVAFRPHDFLEQVAHEAGGRVWSASSNRDLDKLFTEAIRDMRDRYVVTYRPSGVNSSGWHALKVRLARAHGDVVARPGYWVGSR